MDSGYMERNKKVIKLIIFVTLTVGLTVCIETCFCHYLDYPTYTDIVMVDQQDAIFPVVTFCPDLKSKVKVKEDVLKVCKELQIAQQYCLKKACCSRQMELNLHATIMGGIAISPGLGQRLEVLKICSIK